MISKTHQVHPIETFNKITSTTIPLIVRNKVNNWQVGFFKLIYKTKQRVGFFTQRSKTKHTTDGPFLLRSIRILFQKVCPG